MDNQETGAWIDEGMYIKCSVCNVEYDSDLPNLIHADIGATGMPKYCPMCGERLPIITWYDKRNGTWVSVPDESSK